jgi:hypothetical protein
MSGRAPEPDDRRIGRLAYQERVGSEFNATGDGAPTHDDAAITFVLDRVEVGSSPPGSEQYSLFFRGRHDVPLQQNTYHLVHETLGVSDVFLVPIGRSNNFVEYQACFSQPTAND